METLPKKRLFSRTEYYRMAETGILTCTDKTELISGQIILKSPTGPYHASRSRKIEAIFSKLVGDEAQTSSQNPIELGEFSEPEPDFALLKPKEDYYASAHPTPEDVLLLIEVSHSTYAFDKQVKLPLYAEAGIPEVWLINLNESQIEVFKDPIGTEYQEKSVYPPGEKIAVEVLAASVAVQELIG